MKAICDAAVLIGLAKIGRLDLLNKLYKNIYIPWGVYQEVVVRGGKRPIFMPCIGFLTMLC